MSALKKLTVMLNVLHLTNLSGNIHVQCRWYKLNLVVLFHVTIQLWSVLLERALWLQVVNMYV